MFLHTDSYDDAIRPHHSKIRQNDWDILSRYWYPVAVEASVAEDPVPAKLLDVELVVYRSGDEVVVAVDVCPHRHIRLSKGKVIEDNLVCPFHGLAFNGEGQCVKVPALGREAKLPKSYRLRTFRTSVRYGLIWACLSDDSHEHIPDLPDASDALEAGRLLFSLVRDWPVSAPRQIENFIDLAHLPIVHLSSLDTDPSAPVAAARIEQADFGLILTAQLPQRSEGGAFSSTQMEYRLHLPFSIDFRASKEADTPFFHAFDLVAPISAHECRVFALYITDHADGTAKPQASPFQQVSDEDIEVLSYLVRPDLPLDTKHEIHLPVDNVSLAYRKRLRALGLGRP